jgi:hypothetical protein
MGGCVMKELTLFNMTEEGRELASLLKSEDADDITIQNTLESIGFDLETKGGEYIATYKELELLEKGYEEQEARLSSCKKIIKNRKEKLKERLLFCANTLGLERIETNLGIIKVNNSPPALKINDTKAIPASFLTIVPEHTEPNKEAIKTALKNGQEVSGCELTLGKYIKIG